VQEKLKAIEELKEIVAAARASGKKVVFTNGCFDLLHRGHLRLLREAKKLGDVLIVALNSDESVRNIKGPNRPIVPLDERAELLAALEPVDYVTSFEETEPRRLIRELQPHLLVKGGDWSKEQVVGKEIVESYGGEVAVISYAQGYSTTEIIERIRKA
jgi:D-beta-D-heptose 7-phosphate kinase/D-beta-D-heptose 1-phosphate adenosyltransferase